MVDVSRPMSDNISAEVLAEQWRMTGAPYRMTDTEKQIYGRFLQESAEHIDNPKMIVLGVTPELRELGHKYGYSVTCIDFSQTWINAMDILMDGKAEKDIIVRCNWFEIPLQRGEYDVVVGDGPITLTELKNWDRLLEIVHQLLKPAGYFITRTIVGIGDPVPLGDALKIFGERLLRYPEKYMASLWYATMTPQNKMGNNVLEEELKRLRDNGGPASDEFDTICNRLSKMFHVRSGGAYMLEQKHYEKILSKYFQIKGLDYDKALHNIEKPMAIWYIYCLANKS
jgi:hypothetical protein